ncbi:MAG TPA: single-stranded DNA-binding protein [Acidobacteriaceae bacterium]|jgi:single-strand DNA-binding protein
MVQQNMFPNEVRNGKQSQRAANAARTNQPPAGTNNQASTLQNRPARFDQTQKQHPGDTYGNAATSPAPRSDAKRNGRVRLFGRIGRYFEVRQTQSGKSLATFSLATMQPYKDETGNWSKRTVWQRIVAWEETARSLSELLQKGARVSVEGRFKTREWTDKENNLRTATELVARSVRFLDLADA